jgi:hypothetical protein
LDDEALFKLAKSPSGSFVLQTFLQNKTIAEKTKNKILDKLKGKFAQIGQSPQGSRCLETKGCKTLATALIVLLLFDGVVDSVIR